MKQSGRDVVGRTSTFMVFLTRAKHRGQSVDDWIRKRRLHKGVLSIYEEWSPGTCIEVDRIK